MISNKHPQNPFMITSPESLSADDAHRLFVDVFTDFYRIVDPGHVFLFGPRGSGKSMMFRYLQPDCQCLANNCSLQNLPYFSIYIPLKNTNFTRTDLGRLEHRHASDLFNMHILTSYVAIKIFDGIAELLRNTSMKSDSSSFLDYYNDVFCKIYNQSTLRTAPLLDSDENGSYQIARKIAQICESLYFEAMTYADSLAFTQEIPPYTGSLCNYLDFLLPLLSNLRNLPDLPNGPIYLLIDDAHWLNSTQAAVLNTWVSTRTSGIASLKISTEYRYPSFLTIYGDTIDKPHDFNEVDITTIYTGTRKSKYYDRIRDIVAKRLEVWGNQKISPEDFFKADEKQEEAIRQIADNYRTKHDTGQARGFYRSDDAYRYARPDYIRQLSGKHKSSASYSYSGFKQLVHLSSGIIRFFLEPAHEMFAEVLSKSPSGEVDSIDPSIQNQISRETANSFLFDDIERLKKDDESRADYAPQDIDKLSKLIVALGGLFRHLLLSDRSERKVFSIALSDLPGDDILTILDLGVQFGYFHRSTLGRKDSKSGGRTRLYVMSKRLAPIWTLDPTGYAGYLFVTSDFLRTIIEDPLAALRRLKDTGIPEDMQVHQLTLFREDNEHAN